MDTTDQNLDLTTGQNAEQVNADQMRDPLDAPSLDAVSLDTHSLDALGDGPLREPVRRLWEGLDALMRAGRLRGVDLDLAHPDCPCFLLDVAPGLVRLYVELFLDDSPEAEAYDQEEYDPEEEWRPLLVLVNWLGEDTAPAIFELDPALLEGDPSRLGPALAPVLKHVLRMTQSRQS